MLTPSHIFSGLSSSNFVLALYGLIRHILYQIVVGKYCVLTMPLAKHRVITNGPL